MKQNQHFFFQKSSLNSFEVNFTVQSYASLTYEDSAYLQISYHCVYYLKYSELKSFFGHRVGAPKPVYRLLNPSGYVYGIGQQSKQFDCCPLFFAVLCYTCSAVSRKLVKPVYRFGRQKNEPKKLRQHSTQKFPFISNRL